MKTKKENLTIETFSTHFFTNEPGKHFISADDYKIFIDSVEKTLAEINTKILGGHVKYKLCVVANEEGGFWSKFGIVASIVGTGIAVMESKFVHGVYIGLVGQDYNELQVGENIGGFMRDVTVGVFSRNSAELSKIIPRELNLDTAIDAKNKFYRMCAVSPDIVGISFSDSIKPEIEKKDFIHYIAFDTNKILPAEQFVDVVTIVKSVNVNSDAKWSVKIGENTKTQSIDMLDDEFKKEFLSGRYAIKQTEQDDKMTVLLEKKKKYINGHEQDAGLAIVKVYKFNNTQILPIPSDLVYKPHRSKIDLFNFHDETTCGASVE